MSQPTTLTASSIFGLFSLKGAYLVGYAWLFGMSLWVTFFGGIIAFKVLPRQQFGNLQHRTFPIYFLISIGLSSALLGLWTYAHPTVLANWSKPLQVDVFQAYTLALVLVAQSANHFVIGPMTSRCMFARHKLEKEEGKAYTDEGVSDKMKSLNRKFAQLHGWSSMFNLDAVIALIFHGLWIGNHGLGKL